MIYLLFSNNAVTTLASPISSSNVQITLATGTGARFPSPISGQAFMLTLSDALTGLVKEIVQVTALVGDVATVVRAQEGTTALPWLAGDNAGNFYTGGTAQQFLQMPGGPSLPIPVPTTPNTSLKWSGTAFEWI